MVAIVQITALAVFASPALHAQQVRQDPATGHYYVTVYNDADEPVEILVERADLVELSISTTVRPTTTGLRYAYEATVLEGSPQGLSMFQLDCPGPESAIRDFTALRLAEGDRLWTDQGQWNNLPSCFVEFGVRPLKPGQATRAQFTSTLLPTIGEARALGAVHGVSWPTSDPHEANRAAHAFVRDVQGITGGWKSVRTLVPARNPAVLDDPARGLELVREDLDRSCGQLGWITNPGVCRSLEAKLEEAARSLRRGRTDAAREQLESFLAELDAQHGEPPGKHVNDSAYWLLRTNAEYLLSRL